MGSNEYLHALLFGFGMFLLVFAAHILIWRTIRPVNHIAAIFTTFLILPAAALLALILCVLLVPALHSYFHMAAGGSVLYAACACAYIQTYPPMQAQAPSVVISFFIGQSGSQGRSMEELERQFNEEVLVDSRVHDLLNEGFAAEQNGRLCLTLKADALARGFDLYNKIIGIPPGEG